MQGVIGSRGRRPGPADPAGSRAGPGGYSSGERTSRGHITHAGNLHLRTQLVESAWAYKSRPSLGPGVTRRHAGLDPEVVARAWKAQLRLCGRFRRLDARKTSRNVVVTAIARELAGFIWAEMIADTTSADS
jgi:transposase